MPSPLPDSIELPAHRKAGWIKYGDEVVVILVDSQEISIRQGKICSTNTIPPNADGSHSGIDNVTKTVVWGDEPFNMNADSGDDAYEKSFKVQDPHLLKMNELMVLTELESAKKWFEGVYVDDRIIAQIVARIIVVYHEYENRQS